MSTCSSIEADAATMPTPLRTPLRFPALATTLLLALGGCAGTATVPLDTPAAPGQEPA